MSTVNLDRADARILNILQDDARTSIESLTEQVGLSTASVQRRLRKLRESGIIAKEVVIIEHKKIGPQMTFIISVELERENIIHIKQFKARVQKEPRVQQCYYITGESDFILIVTATDMTDFEELTQSLFFNDKNVRRYNTSVTMERTKVSLAIPLNDDI